LLRKDGNLYAWSGFIDEVSATQGIKVLATPAYIEGWRC
jgi:hypothetical protein